MLQLKFRRSLVAVGVLGALLFPVFIGCDSGDTDGGSPAEEAGGTGDQFVSDGGAGGRIQISVDETLGVGETTNFSVSLRDPDGNPIAFVRIFCESEKGIAIIEPSSGGVAFENTGSNGSMSGVIGGLAPGSFILECRAPQGFNLVARETVKITGEIPDGFEGFPGAAGGNLGGGVIVDDTPEPGEQQGVQVTGISVESGSGSVLQVDISRNLSCTATGEPEDFFFDNVTLDFVNNTSQDVILQSVRFSVNDSGAPGTSGNQAFTLPLTAGASGSITVPFTEVVGSGKVFAGGSDVAEQGTWVITFTITGVNENGDTFTFTGNRSVTFGAVDNCPAVTSTTTTTTTTTT